VPAAGPPDARAAEPAAAPPERAAALLPDPYKDLYRDYVPPYASRDGGITRGYAAYVYHKWHTPSHKEMRLSTEPSFYTLNTLRTDSRAEAYIDAAIEKEKLGQHRQALKIYQIVIDDHGDALYRVSRYGIFVPCAQYAQRRILTFPLTDLEHYRTLHDARARESYVQASRRCSLIGLSEIVDDLLATSYGDDALLGLGNAALDQGHYLEALEHYTTIRDFFRHSDRRTESLALRIRLCRKLLGVPRGKTPPTPSPASAAGGAPDLRPEHLARLKRIVTEAKPERPPFHSQLASAPNIAADDYTLFPPTRDPLGLTDPVWREGLPASRGATLVFSQPVVTKDSVIYRYKNVVYCRSLLNGALRWKNDLGGRVTWQSGGQEQLPHEDILVQDGLVFTPMYKIGASLMAIDQVTGQLRWAYGPVVAATEAETQLRFEAAPAGGPRTIFAGYVRDNIVGDTHIDTEYGVIAFESSTGRIQWQARLCRLGPGEFTTGFAVRRRNRIRSFTSPPLYHEGTVYYCTNAGALVALDARSGRVKWLQRYPYYPTLHDATRPFLPGYLSPTLWFNQRPLVDGERLFITPVNSPFLFCIDRKTGKTLWARAKGWREGRSRTWRSGGLTYLLGPTRERSLVLVHSGRDSIIKLVDAATGKTLWNSPDPIKDDPQPVMRYETYIGDGGHVPAVWFNRKSFSIAARPFLTQDDQLYCPYRINRERYGLHPTWCYNLAHLSLRDRKVVERRRYYTPLLQAATASHIAKARRLLEGSKDWPKPTKEGQKRWRKAIREIAADTVPTNRFGPFMPCSRITFERYGVPFELRMGPRSVSMVFDRAALNRVLAKRGDADATFAKAELAIAVGQLERGADGLRQCLATISSEDVDFRARINQILYQVHKQLARSSIRAGNPGEELANTLGMSRTASTLIDEVETLFAVADAYERQGNPMAAARALRSVIVTYGPYEYPVAAVINRDEQEMLAGAETMIGRAERMVDPVHFHKSFGRSLALLKKSLPLYFSALSPLPRDLTVRSNDLAVRKLIALQKSDPAFAKAFEALARKTFAAQTDVEKQYHLWEFPGTTAAQAVLNDLFTSAAKLPGPAGRQQMWRLADFARVCRLDVPPAYRARVTAPLATTRRETVDVEAKTREMDFADEAGTQWLVMERKGDRGREPHRLFLAGRVRKRLDNKFRLTCVDLRTARVLWEATQRRGEDWSRELRLKGKGSEPGFFDAWVCPGRDAKDGLVLVHGLYDVLAFGLQDGRLRWQYRVPFDFEIRHAVASGDLFVLAGRAETIALHIPTGSANGEVAWRQKEVGDLYIPPYFRGDRLILPRKMPFGLTARYRATGELIGRLDLPALSLHDEHPLFESTDPRYTAALPVAHEGDLLIVTDGWYYIAVDTRDLVVRWKRLIDSNDRSREPPMRFELGGDYLAVLKQDYDVKAIYLLESATGRVLWHTDVKDAQSPQPMYSMFIDGGRLYGFEEHPGQGAYFVGRDCRTGRRLFKTEHGGYSGRPKTMLVERRYGRHLVGRVQDRQDFELRAFGLEEQGAAARVIKRKGSGRFGIHGKVSATVQNGRLVLMANNKLGL
jgi:outer membrane protein assembly factor BamB